MCVKLDALLILSRLRVINANIISGPLSWGFPAMTAILGLTHNLMRHFPRVPFKLIGTGVICHNFAPQIAKVGYVHSLKLNRYPLTEEGKSASFVEDGRVHLEVSLVLGLRFHEDTYLSQGEAQPLARQFLEVVQGMRLAGGSVVGASPEPVWLEIPDSEQDQAKTFSSFRSRLLPGFALIDRSECLQPHLEKLRIENPEATAREALMDICALHAEPQKDENANYVGWKIFRPFPGWFVPIPIGYRALSPLYDGGTVDNARDMVTPFRFVECLYSLGEWKSPHRCRLPQELLWTYKTDARDGSYRCAGIEL